MKLKWKELIASLIVIWLPLIYALSIYAQAICPFPLLAGSLYQCRSLYQRSSLCAQSGFSDI